MIDVGSTSAVCRVMLHKAAAGQAVCSCIRTKLGSLLFCVYRLKFQATPGLASLQAEGSCPALCKARMSHKLYINFDATLLSLSTSNTSNQVFKTCLTLFCELCRYRGHPEKRLSIST